MAHEVYEVNGRHSMAYSGEVPWHGLGQHVDPDATLGEWLREAELEWTVRETPVIFGRGVPMGREADLRLVGGLEYVRGQKVLYRSDDGTPLAVVTDRYRPVQPIQVLSFFRDLVDVHGFKIVTAGSLRGGSRVWALASVNLEARIGRDDVIKPYVLLTTSYDRSLATTAQFTTVQVVCDNTLGFAYQEGENAEAADRRNPGRFADVIRIPHVCEMTEAKVREVQGKLGLASEAFYEFADAIEALAERKVGEDDAARFFARLLHDDRLGDDFSDVSPRVAKRLAETYLTGQGQDVDSRKGTAWGLVSAVTRYVDHGRRYRSADTRFDGAVLGSGEAMKQRAMALATELLG